MQTKPLVKNICSDPFFHQMYTHAKWTDPEHGLSTRFSVSILLPYEVATEDVTVSVVDDGNHLQIDVI